MIMTEALGRLYHCEATVQGSCIHQGFWVGVAQQNHVTQIMWGGDHMTQVPYLLYCALHGYTVDSAM